MATPLKDLYSKAFVKEFTEIASPVIPKFDAKVFTKKVFDKTWESRELKDRMAHLAVCLTEQLPSSFPKTAKLICKLFERIKAVGIEGKSLEYMFLPAILENEGIGHPELALDAMEQITNYSSCEFAIRPFFLKYPEILHAKILMWSVHPDEHVRRLASEGCRPRLPWAMGLPYLKKDPTPILPVLQRLCNDPELYVRRSVANNLNDISKDHPALALKIAQTWKGKNKNLDWVVKHACRSLLKQGMPEVMFLFGFARPEQVELLGLKVGKKTVAIGNDLLFSFTLINKGKSDLLLRLEYGIYFLLANGKQSRKVFFISERMVPPGMNNFDCKKTFRPITTRTYYPGEHAISIIVNGKELERLPFSISE